ncbi:hypothetical protein SUGI_0348870 [Cryptomeria japonica]|nr:hypothetical protein SUGI_0348870 [Cryptomeria japonica]
MDEFKAYEPPIEKISLENRRYHVFLNFRGKDTRKSLVAYLFELLSAAGLHVFMDSKRIRKGDVICSQLEQAIEEAVIHIPIFSPNYVESRWCLRELTQMLKSKGLVIPLFYGVEPADVKYAENRIMYREAFKLHREKGREEEKTINEWSDTLSQVGSFSGWTTQASNPNEIKFIRGVVSDVLKTLKIAQLGVPRFAVGLKERMDGVIKLLKMDDKQKVITVGIWGAHGAGKSTVARAVYNSICGNFKVFTFVSDIAGNRLRKLQKQLLRDLLKWNPEECKINDEHHGKAKLEEHLQNICALVILDNVDNRKQIEMLGVEWLGEGSRVIVTTRDKSILNFGENEGSEADDQIYAIPELRKEESLQLFSWHAFLKPYPDKKYKFLAQGIVDACGALPSSLEILGRFLCGRKDFRCWTEVLDQLQSATFDEIYRPLKVIYQDLNAKEKQILLDIACFFMGHDQEAAISFWEDIKLNPHINLKNLVLKSLVKIDYKEAVISMHDHLRDLGRAIVVDESWDPSKRSRLWKSEEASQVLLERPGYESIQSISLLAVEESLAVLKAENIASTKKLQLLWLGNNTIEGDPQPLFSNLRWFRWNSCPLSSLPPKWNMEHLVILDLSSSRGIPSQIKQIWKEESKYKHHPKNLKVLLLRRCLLLETLPDLSNFSRLLRIDLEDCPELRKIPESIGLLLQLKWLNLCRCKDLGELPESIGSLSSLEKLYLNGCSSIRTLPRTLGNLRALKELDLGGLVLIEELPPFQTGCCLQKLVLSGCRSLRDLPASIGDLNHLSYLEINECRTISYLPEEFGNLTSLEGLFLNEFCRLENLPESFGNLTNLVTLELKKAYCLTKLPESFSKLESLVYFDASFSHLYGLPARMGDLSSLQTLKLQGTFIEGLPNSLKQLKMLQTLILNECNMLTELPALPEALIKFQARDCKELRKVDQMSGLSNLTVMDLRNCQCLEELPILSSMESLAKIDIRGCISMKNLADLRLGRLRSLQTVYLSRSDSSCFNLRQVVEDMPLFRRSNALEEENRALEANCFKDVVSFPVEKNPRCEGVLLFFQLEFNARGIKSACMEIIFVIDEEETINSLTVDTEGEEEFILIFRATHEMVVALEKARNLCVRAKGEGICIRFVELRVSNKFQEAVSEENRGADHGSSEGERIRDLLLRAAIQASVTRGKNACIIGEILAASMEARINI